VINILAADQLMTSPRTYSTALLWLLSELFERLPEVGDLDKPKLVFFFDEAHLLFSDLPQAIEDKIEQVVRLIRSKGVGIYFITQNPLDIPEKVLGQLGNRVQHALRAFTPRDQKAVQSAARLSGRIPSSTSPRPSASSPSAKRSSRSSTTPGRRPSSSARPWSRAQPNRTDHPPGTHGDHSKQRGLRHLRKSREPGERRRDAARADGPSSRRQSPGFSTRRACSTHSGISRPVAPPARSRRQRFQLRKDMLFGPHRTRGGHYAGLAEKMASSAVRSMGSSVGRRDYSRGARLTLRRRTAVGLAAHVVHARLRCVVEIAKLAPLAACQHRSFGGPIFQIFNFQFLLHSRLR